MRIPSLLPLTGARWWTAASSAVTRVSCKLVCFTIPPPAASPRLTLRRRGAPPGHPFESRFIASSIDEFPTHPGFCDQGAAPFPTPHPTRLPCVTPGLGRGHCDSPRGG
eukprot:gene14520-biopygen579